MNEFYEAIKAAVEEENHDKDKYLKLAAMAPTDKARRILTDISAEETRHREFLQGILDDAEIHKEQHAEPAVIEEEPPEVSEV